MQCEFLHNLTTKQYPFYYSEKLFRTTRKFLVGALSTAVLNPNMNIVHWKAFWWIKKPSLVPTLCFSLSVCILCFLFCILKNCWGAGVPALCLDFFILYFVSFYFSTLQNCWAAWEPEFHHPTTFHLLSMHFSFLYNWPLKKYSKFTHSGLQEEKNSEFTKITMFFEIETDSKPEIICVQFKEVGEWKRQ